MNERIKELADKARIKQLGDSWCYVSPKEFEEKFANLLIEEAIRIINATPSHHCYTTFDKDHSDSTKMACIKQLQKELL